jgi:LemA protein
MGLKELGIGLIAVLTVLAVVALIGISTIGGIYNSMVQADNSVAAHWGNVQSVYQRRAELVPNLVATVQGSANFEQSTLTKIAQYRSQAGTAGQSVANAQPGDTDAVNAADTQMESAISRLLVVVEAYPTIQSTQAFRDLQSQLEGTENRVKYERDEYNTEVQNYKNTLQTFPNNIIAGMFNFNANKWKMFAATDTAQTAPTVVFNITGSG